MPGTAPLRAPLDAPVAERAARWLAGATDAASPDTQLFARLIAARDVRHELALLGLPQPAWRALVARHFAHCLQHLSVADALLAQPVDQPLTGADRGHADAERAGAHQRRLSSQRVRVSKAS